jgi:hypothetical protein
MILVGLVSHVCLHTLPKRPPFLLRRRSWHIAISAYEAVASLSQVGPVHAARRMRPGARLIPHRNQMQPGDRLPNRGNSSSAQAASHNVLTVTRMRLRAVGTGGQKKKLPVPSFPGKPRQSPGMPVCSFPASSVALTWKHGAIMGQYSPCTQGCPYNRTPTSSPWAETLSITAVACSSGSRAASPRCLPGSKRAVRWARRPTGSPGEAARPVYGQRGTRAARRW